MKYGCLFSGGWLLTMWWQEGSSFLPPVVCVFVCVHALVCIHFLSEGRTWEWKVTKALEYIRLQTVFSVTRVTQQIFSIFSSSLLTLRLSRSLLSMTFSLNNTASGDLSLFFSHKLPHHDLYVLTFPQRTVSYLRSLFVSKYDWVNYMHMELT